MLTVDKEGLCSHIGTKHIGKLLQKVKKKHPSFNTKKVPDSAMKCCGITFREKQHQENTLKIC